MATNVQLAVQALLLDVDDTLVDTRGAMMEAGRQGARAAWPDIDDGLAESVARQFRADPGQRFAGFEQRLVDYPTMRRARFRDAAQAWGLQVGESEFSRWEDTYLRVLVDQTRLFDDAKRLLARAAKDNLLLGVLSNATGYLTRQKLVATGIADMFSFIGSVDELGVGKPDPQAYLVACSDWGLPPQRVGFCGDDLARDAVGARDAGLWGVWLDRRAQWDGTEVGVPVIHSLDELTWR